MKLSEMEIIPAKLLDGDGKAVAEGRARFIGGQARGVSWPTAPVTDEALKSGVLIEILSGEKTSISNVQRCPAQWPSIDYDFDWSPESEEAV